MKLLTWSTDQILSLADSDFIVSLLKAEEGPVHFAGRLFSRDAAGRNDIEPDSRKPTALLGELARRILDKPEEFPFGTVVAAANYATEAWAVELPPILQEESALELSV